MCDAILTFFFVIKMSNQVYASQEQRLFAQYELSAFTIVAESIPQGPLVNPVALAISPVSLVGNFDGSISYGNKGVSAVKAGVYTISFMVNLMSPAPNTDFRAETYLSISKDDVFTGETIYCRSGNKSGNAGGGTHSYSSQSGSVTTFLPAGYVAKVVINNYVLNEPVDVLGTSKLEIIRLL